MGQYTIAAFAKRASVTVRTLRYYHQVGLLVPSAASPAGYRLYTEADMPRLQRILALKYLGFSLAEIRRCLEAGPQDLLATLEVQQAMLAERQARLEAIQAALERTRARLRQQPQDWDALTEVIRLLQEPEQPGWVRKYFTPEQFERLQELSQAAYAPEAAARVAQWGQGWTEADQQAADARWTDLRQRLRALVAAGADPAGAEAQALRRDWRAQVEAFTRRDPQVEQGLRRLWENVRSLPEAERPLAPWLDEAEQRFLDVPEDPRPPSE